MRSVVSSFDKIDGMLEVGERVVFEIIFGFLFWVIGLNDLFLFKLGNVR